MTVARFLTRTGQASKIRWLDLTPKTMAAKRSRLLCRALPCRWWPIRELPGVSVCLRCGVSK